MARGDARLIIDMHGSSSPAQPFQKNKRNPEINLNASA